MTLVGHEFNSLSAAWIKPHDYQPVASPNWPDITGLSYGTAGWGQNML